MFNPIRPHQTKRLLSVFSFDRIPENTRKLCEELGGTVDFSVSYLINGTIPQKVPHAKKLCSNFVDTLTTLINKIDIGGAQQSWYFCTFFKAKYILIYHIKIKVSNLSKLNLTFGLPPNLSCFIT